MVGAPDWYDTNRPTRPLLGEKQTRYLGTTTGTVASGGGSLNISITPTSGYVLNASAVNFACETSSIQIWRIYIDGVILYQGRFDKNEFLPFPESAAYTVTAAETLKIEVVNNDSSNRDMRISIAGTLEQVS